MFERALIVDSHLHTRRGLARDLAEYQVVRSVIEADSIRDGLHRLKHQPFHACFLGSTLQPSTALGFIEEGRICSLDDGCAFLVLHRENSPAAEALLSVADGVIKTPYTKETLTSVVTRAIESQAIREVPPREIHALCLSQRLERLAADLRAIAAGLTTGKFSLQGDGTPGANTDHAFRKAMEQILPERNQHNDIPSDDQEFLQLASTWLTKRVHGNHGEILDMLRKRVR